MIFVIFEILAYDLLACTEGLENLVQEGEIVESSCEFLGTHISDNSTEEGQAGDNGGADELPCGEGSEHVLAIVAVEGFINQFGVK